MEAHFDRVKRYLLELGCEISQENQDDQIVVVNHEEDGISNLVVGCSDPILILEQHLFQNSNLNGADFREMMIKNRDIVHGALVLDETGEHVIFRDTLQIENLDKNEIEGSINALGLLLTEYSDRILEMSKK